MTGGLFAILDDIALLLDDAASMSKIAAKKTAGILGDDLAVNAEKATGFQASRELPVIWAITKGSFLNKLIILPVAFLLSTFLPWLIVPILLIGGAYLCFEGAEKILDWCRPTAHNQDMKTTESNNQDADQQEQVKIKSAIRTDFILSIEIIVIALGTVIEQSLAMQVIVVSFISLLATVGVYGLVALLVRMDDMGFYLVAHSGQRTDFSAKLRRQLGRMLITSLPYSIRMLGVVGTIAMLLVGGGMYSHNIHWLHGLSAWLPSILADLIIGIIVGVLVALCLAVFSAIRRYFYPSTP